MGSGDGGAGCLTAGAGTRTGSGDLCQAGLTPCQNNRLDSSPCCGKGEWRLVGDGTNSFLGVEKHL